MIKISKALNDELCELTVSMLDDRGREMPNPKPMELTAGLRRPENLQGQIQRLVRTALSQEVADQGMETFEEANDFDIVDGFDVHFNSTYQQMDEEYLDQSPEPIKVEGSNDNLKKEEKENGSDLDDRVDDLQSDSATDRGEGDGQRVEDR